MLLLQGVFRSGTTALFRTLRRAFSEHADFGAYHLDEYFEAGPRRLDERDDADRHRRWANVPGAEQRFREGIEQARIAELMRDLGYGPL